MLIVDSSTDLRKTEVYLVQALRIAANIAKLPEPLGKPSWRKHL